MSLAIVMIEIDKLAVNVALPSIQRDLHTGFGVLQWTIGIYMLTLAALLVVGGRLGDVFGRRRIFLIGVVVFAVASLLAGISQTSTELILARAVQGVGAAFMYPATFALVATAYPEERRGRAVGVIATAAGFGMAIGPLVGGVLVQSLSWRWVFFINPIVAAAAIPLALRYVREERDEDADRRVDFGGVATLITGVTALMFAFIQAADGSDTGLVAATSVAGLVLLGAFVAIERRSPSPLVSLALLRHPAFAGVMVVATVAMFVIIAWLFVTTLEIQHVLRNSPVATGVIMLPYVVAFFACARPAGALVDRIGYRIPLAGGLAILAALMGVLGIAARTVPYDEVWYLFALIGATQALIWPALAATAITLAPPGDAGVATGILQTLRFLGGGFGVAVIGGIFAVVHRGGLHDELLNEGVEASTRTLHALDALLASERGARAAAFELVGVRGVGIVENAARAAEMNALATSLLVLAGCAAVGAAVAAVLFQVRDAKPAAAVPRTAGVDTGRGA